MAKFKKALFFFVSIALLLSSCKIDKTPLTNQYGPALYQNDVAYMPKPLSSDKKHVANYVSVAVAESNGPDPTNTFDSMTRGELNFGQGFTFSNFNLAYNIFGTAGSYSNGANSTQNDAYFFNNKFYGAAGGRFSFDGYITSGRVDIRLIGFEMAYSHEFGDYAAYRRMVTGQPGFYTNTRTQLVTIGGSSEVIWHSSDPNLQFGFRVFVGKSLNGNAYTNNGSLSPLYDNYNYTSALAYFMQVHRYFFIGELNSSGGQLRVGLKF